MDINSLRESIKTRRDTLNPADRSAWSQQIAATCLQVPGYINSQRIAIYISHRQEVDTTPIITQAWKDNKALYLPILAEDGHHLYFVPYTPDTVLHQNRYGIYEPHYQPEHSILAQDLDCVITPLVAFDEHCHRIGMGAGFYDRSFYFLNQDPRPAKPVMIGLAYDFQKEVYLERQPWDVNLNMIITPSQIYSLDISIERIDIQG